jgi:hypothetical protein
VWSCSKSEMYRKNVYSSGSACTTTVEEEEDTAM